MNGRTHRIVVQSSFHSPPPHSSAAPAHMSELRHQEAAQAGFKVHFFLLFLIPRSSFTMTVCQVANLNQTFRLSPPRSASKGLLGIDEIDRVNATQNNRDIAEGARSSAGKYLNCKHFEMKKWRNLTAKVTKPS
ncbi:hypothetical protein QQP08_023233 [Theobroma cacao]|nr:hypothetical protein QQP08_023233 [Theobroma cacao]